MTTRRGFLLSGLLTLAIPTLNVEAAEPIRVLIVDGRNNHNWQVMTPFLKGLLEGSDRFQVAVATTPEKGAPSSAWSGFRPDFKAFDVVLSNYNGEPWPKDVESSLENYVAEGGGLVIVHAANNAFPDWDEWNKMIGLGWRQNSFGDRVTVNDRGEVVRTPKGEGPGSGHGPQHEFTVVVRDPDHPIMKGMPKEWKHTKDELYHGQRGPAQDMHILATAYSSTENRGTGTNEPLVWEVPYGKGRVFTCLLGHNMADETVALQCVGFQTLILRGTEWAATGTVTIPVPDNFPSADETSLSQP